jgi:multidrug resistance efflux pump
MPSDFEATDSFGEALGKLAGLRRFSGPPTLFWQSYIDALVALTGARFGLVARRREGEAPGWRKVVASPANLSGDGLKSFFAGMESLCDACLDKGVVTKEVRGAVSGNEAEVGVAVRLDTGRPSERWVAVFLLTGKPAASAGEVVKQLLLANCLPADVQHFQSSNRAPGAAAQAASVLDLVVLLDAHKKFVAMAMAFANEIAARHHCERVSLGWEERGALRVQAISHTDKFERKMEAVKELEQAMEESYDQDEEIYWPPLDGETLITRDHGTFAGAQGVKHMCSVPLRVDGQPVAVLTLERNSDAFLEDEIRLLRLTSDLATPRLTELKKRDRWFGARAMGGVRGWAAKLIGPEHTWAKILAVVGAIALGILFLGGMDYRVEAPFLLRTESISYLSAPFNGFIAEVDAEIGMTSAKGQRLLSLDTRDLLLEEAGAAADLMRFRREEEKARAVGELADMRISAAQAEQARVRLELVRFRLSQADIRSPFDAFVVEGDLKKRLGAPVRQGDVLFKVARLDRLYIECKVKERDIHEIAIGAPVEIAFASQPKHKFPAKVKLIEPIATTTENENVFIVRCEVSAPPEKWWRPGLAGTTKITAGHRTFFWILFHRTIDFLRLLLWW